MEAIYKQLKNYGIVKINKELSKCTTFRVGGPARLYVEVSETEKLVGLLDFLTGEGVDYFILGGGSNLLFSDDGYEGVVIKIKTSKLSIENNIICADAGVLLAQVVNLAAQDSLSGMEWGAGIPGTIGGAVRGNAGAYGSDTSKTLNKVLVWSNGEVFEKEAKDCNFGYRESDFKRNGEVVLRAWFTLLKGDKSEILKKTQEFIMDRVGKFPPLPSAGSFFKNIFTEDFKGDRNILPEKFVSIGKVGAAWLLDQCGLKGYAVGGAKISDEHANFIVNFNNATQSDILKVVEKAKEEVYNKFGVELEEEVQIIY